MAGQYYNGGVKTRQQMAEEYGVCRKTFVRLLTKKRCFLEKGLITPLDQLIIYSKLGKPNLFTGKDNTIS